MEDQIKLSVGAIITLALAISGTYFVADDDLAYYCEAKDLVMICEKLSSGLGTRCYYEDTYKICKLGWEEIEIGQSVKDETVVTEYIYPDVPEATQGKKWKCSPKGCVGVS